VAAIIKDVRRPRIADMAAGGDAPSGKKVNAQYLVVTLDLDNDGRRMLDVVFTEDDHTGLIAEYTTGTATTILDAAVVSHLSGLGDYEYLSATQKSWLGTSKSWP